MAKIKTIRVDTDKAIICPICQTTVFPYESSPIDFGFTKCEHLLFIIRKSDEPEPKDNSFKDTNVDYCEYRSARFNFHMGLCKNEETGPPKDFDISLFSSFDSLTKKVTIPGTVTYIRGQEKVGFAPNDYGTTRNTDPLKRGLISTGPQSKRESIILIINGLITSFKDQINIKITKENKDIIEERLKKIEQKYKYLEDQLKMEVVLCYSYPDELPPFRISDIKTEDIKVFNPKKIAAVTAREIEDVVGRNSYIRMQLDLLWDVWKEEAELRGLDISKPIRPSLIHACKLFDRIYESSIHFAENGPDPSPGYHGEVIACLTQQFVDRRKFLEALRSQYVRTAFYDPSYGKHKKDQYRELACVISDAAWHGEIKIALEYTKRIPIEMDLQSETYTEIVRVITHSSKISSDCEKLAISVIRKITNPLCKIYAQNFLIVYLLKKKKISKALDIEKSGKFCSLAVIIYYLKTNQHKKAWDKTVEFEKNDEWYVEPTELLKWLEIDDYTYYRIVPWIQ